MFGKKHSFIALLLAATWGALFGLSMSKRPGKEVRNDILKKWEKGESPTKAKMSVLFKELYYAIKDVPKAFEEFLESPKMKSYEKKGKEYFDGKLGEGKEIVDKKLKEGKKKALKVIKDLKKKVK